VAGVLVALSLSIGMAVSLAQARRAQLAAASEAVQNREAQERAREARWAAYTANIAAAVAAINAFDLTDAKRRLELCPVEHRNFEWSHLFARLDRSRLTIPSAPTALAVDVD